MDWMGIKINVPDFEILGNGKQIIFIAHLKMNVFWQIISPWNENFEIL